MHVAPTEAAAWNDWFRVSLIKQYLNGEDEIEYLTAADEMEWVRENVDRIEQSFADGPTIDTTCESLKPLRRSNANRYWTDWRKQQGLT